MSTPARADFNIATGLKWVPLRYTAPVGAGSEGASTGTGAASGDWYKATGGNMYGWQSTSLDNYIAFFFTEQVGLQLSLDIGWGSHSSDTNTMMGGQFSTSYFQFGLGVGGKFYLNRPTRERVSPYILLSIFKYFASVSSNDPAVTRDVDVTGSIAGFHSPVGFDAAFGAEYFFTTSFSIGAEVLGMRFAHVEGQVPIPMSNFRVFTSENYFTLYTGISLNYRFLATASVHTYEEDEDRQNPRPRARKRRPAPPPRDNGDDGNDGNPPAASPESVD